MLGHEIEIEQNIYTLGYEGFCECSDPNYEDGWAGQVVFAGNTEQEILDQHHDHLLEVEGAYV